ncbi:MAG: TSUP family transporter, partial [Actinobacteria bacterium]|nr:TSUP family transporter [Actinomycetota bacterium]
MTVFLLVLAGVAGGLCGSVAGLASIVTYPALLAAGLAPLQANVTNTVALVFTSIGSVSASRTELAGQRAKITPLAVIAVAGGAVGGLVLLLAPADSFEVVVP